MSDASSVLVVLGGITGMLVVFFVGAILTSLAMDVINDRSLRRRQKIQRALRKTKVVKDLVAVVHPDDDYTLEVIEELESILEE